MPAGRLRAFSVTSFSIANARPRLDSWTNVYATRFETSYINLHGDPFRLVDAISYHPHGNTLDKEVDNLGTTITIFVEYQELMSLRDMEIIRIPIMNKCERTISVDDIPKVFNAR